MKLLFKVGLTVFGSLLLSAEVGNRGAFAASAKTAPTYHLTTTWTLGGDGGWDYLLADSDAHRLYVTRGNRVMVVDTESGKLIGEITGLQGTHGVALDSDGKRGYVSDGAAGMIRIFDRTTLKVTDSVAVGQNPDAILFEPTKKYVFTFNGRSSDASVYDTVANNVVETIPLPGKPEFSATDGRGTVWVNIEDKNELQRIDVSSLKVTATWPLSDCESPSGLAFDKAKRRLFSVCGGKKMVVTDADTGKVLATPTIGDGPDAAAFDARNKLAFSSNGEGTVSVVREDAGGYSTVQTVPTKKSARTMALDAATGKIYLVAADFGPRPAPTATSPRPRPPVLPGTFRVLVIEP